MLHKPAKALEIDPAELFYKEIDPKTTMKNARKAVVEDFGEAFYRLISDFVAEKIMEIQYGRAPDILSFVHCSFFFFPLFSMVMNYYAIQVKTRGERKFIRLFKSFHPEVELPMYFPQRRINIRRRGIVKPSTAAVFPGYIFIEAESEDIIARQWAFRRTEGFYRFLKSNQDIVPLSDRDLELALHFIKKAGPVAGISKVYFNEDSRIVVVEGALAGLEGRIIKVDKRKKRAKVKLSLYDDSFAIDLAFEVMDSLDRR